MGDAMTEQTRRYTGGCHCGKVRYDVSLELGPVLDCNCSICAKHGFLWAYTTSDKFTLLSGADVLTEYRFGSGGIRHVFCSRCGVESFADGPDPKSGKLVVGINVRCLDGIDVSALELQHFDGKAL